MGQKGSQRNQLQIPRTSPLLFSDRQLREMILPLFFEQLLLMLVGIADTFVVSYCKEAAVSGVSLVNSFNTIFLFLFTALSSGGAVIVSQYLGRKENTTASQAVSQLLSLSLLFSLAVAIVTVVGNEEILGFLFGRVEPEVMEAGVTYLRISAYSYPLLAVYNAGAALYRSIGKTSTTMYISVLANFINVAGNCIGVFLLHAGVAGVAWPSFLSRGFSALLITGLCFGKSLPIRYRWQWIFTWNSKLQKKILGIALPNGIESGIFQFVKVALSSVAALFGTSQIAANGIAQSIWSLAALMCTAMGPVFITVIGRCMGSGEIKQAEFYFKKLLKLTLGLAFIWNVLVFAVTPLILKGYAVSEETKSLVLLLVLIHNLFNAVAFPLADPLGKGLRAAGDVGFTTGVSIFTTVGIRLVFSWLFALVLRGGVIGIAWAMCLDWIIRGIILLFRLRQGKWKRFQII